jgi:hypothetical protein
VTRIPDINNFRRQGFILACDFRGFSYGCLALCTGQNIMVAGVCAGGVFHLTGNWKKREEQITSQQIGSRAELLT